MSLLSLQGPINLAKRLPNAKPGPFKFVGVADSCEIALEVNTVEQVESHTGNRLTVGSLVMGKTATLSLTLKDWSIANLALVLYGKEIEVTSGSVTAEVLPAGLMAGDRIRLDNPFISALVLTGATALVEGTDYQIESENAGLVKILTDQTGTVTAAYTHADTSKLGLFTSPPPERWFLLDGINTNTDERLVIQLYKVKFNPVSNLGLLHNEGFGELPITAQVLADMDQPIDSELGNFGSIAMKVEA